MTRVSSCAVELLLKVEVCPVLPILMLSQRLNMIRLSPSLQKIVTLSLSMALATLKTRTPTPMKKMASTLAEDVHRHQVMELMLTIPMENTASMDLSMEARAYLAPIANLNPPTKAGAIRGSTAHPLATTLESRAIQASTAHPLAIQLRAIRGSTAHLLTIQQRVIQASTALALATILETHLIAIILATSLIAIILATNLIAIILATSLIAIILATSLIAIILATSLIAIILETNLIVTIPKTHLIVTIPKKHPFTIPSRDRRASIARLLTPAAKEVKVAPKAYKLVDMAIHTLLTLAPEWRLSTPMIQQLDTTLFSVKELCSESIPLRRAIQRSSQALTRRKSPQKTPRCTRTLRI